MAGCAEHPVHGILRHLAHRVAGARAGQAHHARGPGAGHRQGRRPGRCPGGRPLLAGAACCAPAHAPPAAWQAAAELSAASSALATSLLAAQAHPARWHAGQRGRTGPGPQGGRLGQGQRGWCLCGACGTSLPGVLQPWLPCPDAGCWLARRPGMRCTPAQSGGSAARGHLQSLPAGRPPCAATGLACIRVQVRRPARRA